MMIHLKQGTCLKVFQLDRRATSSEKSALLMYKVCGQPPKNYFTIELISLGTSGARAVWRDFTTTRYSRKNRRQSDSHAVIRSTYWETVGTRKKMYFLLYI